MFQNNIYKVIGMMSGTSLDGVDIAYCEFEFNNKWQYKIIQAETIPYNNTWLIRLKELHKQPAFIFPKTDAFYGKYLGQLANDFIKKYQLEVDFISSHGHTIFHQPDNGFTAQIGSGANIYAETGITTINDFRVVDVALGGQGAPLVPIGDDLLFNDFDACLNLGGFSNISFKKENHRIAFDISPCNIILNPIANLLGLEYDDEGHVASEGTVNELLLNKLNDLSYYQKEAPKSLGIEWVIENIWPVVNQFETSPNDLLATLSKHIAQQIIEVTQKNNLKNILTTGGGAFNKHLIDEINLNTNSKLFVPDKSLINFKEALIFAFLGVLRFTNHINCHSIVTGAKTNSISGCIWGNTNKKL
jgi:anhydro-N-acetylmuramic acid kinase